MGRETDKELFIIKMEDVMRVIGKIIKCLGSENYTMKQGKQLIKVNGSMIISMAEENFTMIASKN